MDDVTSLMNGYRECARHLWNNYFRAEAESKQDWDLRDTFEDIAVMLFRALVLRKLKQENSDILPNYCAEHAPLEFLRVDVDSRSEVLVNRTGTGGYWDDPLKEMESGDCDMRFLHFFDWDELGFRDFSFYRVRIVGSKRYPHLAGRDALLPAGGGVKVFYAPEHG